MKFLIGSTLRFGWELFTKRPWLYVGATLLVFLAYVVAGLLTNAINISLGGSADQPTLIGSAVSIIVYAAITMCTTGFYLAAHDNPDTVGISALLKAQPFLKYLGTYVLFWIGFAVGLVLLVIPGIVFGLMFMFATCLVIDRDLGPIDAMYESYRITLGYKWDLFGFVYVLIIVSVLGLIALILGVLVTAPLTSLAFVHAYRALAGPAPATRDASLSV